MPREFRQDSIAQRLTDGRQIITPSSTHASAWTWSRLVVMDDGLPMPILTLLAREVFPEWDPKIQHAFWKDHDPTNESGANIGFADVEFRRKRSKPALGMKSGTKEYWKKYRQLHADRLKTYHKERAVKQRQFAKAYEEAIARGEVQTDTIAEVGLEDIFESVTRVGVEKEKK